MGIPLKQDNISALEKGSIHSKKKKITDRQSPELKHLQDQRQNNWQWPS